MYFQDALKIINQIQHKLQLKERAVIIELWQMAKDQ